MMSNIYIISVLLLLLHLSDAEQLRFGSFRGVPFIFNYTEGDSWCNPSFECDIISYLCWKLGNNDCSLTVFDSLEERLTSLEKNDVDIVVSRFSVSPERAERVDFVRPYYYSTGAILFSAPQDKDDFVAYEDLLSEFVCMDVGYYVAQTLVDDYGLFVFPSTKESVVELVNREFCIAAIMDSVFIIDGLVQANLRPLYETPYAIAISKTPTIHDLKNKVQKVLLEMMTKKVNEEKSFLENIEEVHLSSVGISQNFKLRQLSDAITANNGEYIGAENEDKIWQAANLTAVKTYSEELIFIDPDNEKFCRDSMSKIYNSYLSGTPLENLEMDFQDALAYTFVLKSSDPANFFNTMTIEHHPFFEPGVPAQEILVDNPQFVTTNLAIQQSFFEDENNKNQGAFFYSTMAFDAAPVLNDPNITANVPTRVIKTSLFQTLQDQNEDNEFLLLIGCGIGEIREW